jgi:hypothetical protein
MSSVGQLSDPFQNKQDDEFEDVSISGMPLEPDEPPPEQADDDEAPGDGDVVYDLDDWSDMERQAVTDRLREAGIPHAWDGTELHVAAEDEAPVENILDLVEGESAGDEEDAEDEAEALDASRDQVAYDLAEWDDHQVDELVDQLTAAGIAFAWDEDELYVYTDDEDAADEVFDKVSEAAGAATADRGGDDGMAGAELLGGLFVAADRLQHDCEDHEGVISMLEMSKAIEGSDPPYGVGAAEWKHLVEQVVSLSDLLLEDNVDEEAVTTQARDLRTSLRPFV